MYCKHLISFKTAPMINDNNNSKKKHLRFCQSKKYVPMSD